MKMTQTRCMNNECREWFDKHLGDCPKCGKPIEAFNKSLRMGALNANLYAQAETA